MSAIIPVYNGERYLAPAIESALAQTYPPLEVIVVDDGSTDETAIVASGFGQQVTYYRQAHTGPGAARNRGIELARGELLAFLDADDLWEPDKLARQVVALETEADLEAVFGSVRQFYSPDLDVSVARRIRLIAEVMPGIVPGTMLIRKDAFLRVGWFVTTLRIGEFIDWHSRAVEARLRMLMLPEVVMQRRLHEANLGIRERDAAVDYVRLLKAALDRRRHPAGAPASQVASPERDAGPQGQ